MSNLDNPDENDAYFPLVWSIDKLMMEGIADLIDKGDILERTPRSDYDREYIEHYRASKNHLQQIDSLLQRIARDPSRVEELGKAVRRELPRSVCDHSAR